MPPAQVLPFVEDPQLVLRPRGCWRVARENQAGWGTVTWGPWERYSAGGRIHWEDTDLYNLSPIPRKPSQDPFMMGNSRDSPIIRS